MFVITMAKLPEYELHTKISMGPRATCTKNQPLYPLLPHTSHAPVNPHVSPSPKPISLCDRRVCRGTAAALGAPALQDVTEHLHVVNTPAILTSYS